MLFRDYKSKLFVDTQSVRNIYLEPSKWVKESSAKRSEYFCLLILAEFVIHTTFCNYRRKHCMPTTSFVFIAHCSFTCVALLLTLRDESTVEFQLFQTLFYIFGANIFITHHSEILIVSYNIHHCFLLQFTHERLYSSYDL